MMLIAIEYLYELLPNKLEDELDFDLDLRKKKHPAEARNLDADDKSWLLHTDIGKSLVSFCSADRTDWRTKTA
jgi:hypothetical protein